LAPIKTTSARQTRRLLRLLRERVESGRADDLREAKIGSGRHQVAMGPNLSRWRKGPRRDGFGTKASIDRRWATYPATLSGRDPILKRAIPISHIIVVVVFLFACCCICSFFCSRVFVITIVAQSQDDDYWDNLRSDVNNLLFIDGINNQINNDPRMPKMVISVMRHTSHRSVIFGFKWEMALRMLRSWNTKTGYMTCTTGR